jgi:hypothetical protein
MSPMVIEPWLVVIKGIAIGVSDGEIRKVKAGQPANVRLDLSGAKPTKENAWFWTVSIDERRLATGYAMSDREAAQAVEDAVKQIRHGLLRVDARRPTLPD